MWFVRKADLENVAKGHKRLEELVLVDLRRESRNVDRGALGAVHRTAVGTVLAAWEKVEGMRLGVNKGVLFEKTRLVIGGCGHVALSLISVSGRWRQRTSGSRFRLTQCSNVI